MQFIRGAVVLGLAASFCMVHAMAISGTVKDSLSGVGISGAKVKLIRSGDSTLTNAAGNFGFGVTVGTVDRSSKAIGPSVPIMSAQGQIRLSLPEASHVTVKTYSVEGKQIGFMQKTLGAGNHSIMPVRTNSGVCIYQVVINGKAYTLQQTNLNDEGYTKANVRGGAIPFEGLTKNAAGLAAQFPDTLRVTKAFYEPMRRTLPDSVASGVLFLMKPNVSDCPLITSTNSGVAAGDFYVTNNLIATSGIQQSLYVCFYSYWYVVANMAAGNGSIKSFPNVQYNYKPGVAISSLNTYKFAFTSVTPHVANMKYTACIDFWVNCSQGLAKGATVLDGCEIQIWHDNWYVPTTSLGAAQTAVNTIDSMGLSAGVKYIPYVYTNPTTSKITKVTFVGGPYYQSFPKEQNLLSFMKYAIAQNWIPANSTLSQFSYGFKIISTAGIPAMFLVKDIKLLQN